MQFQASFGEAVRSALVENYCNFRGRSSRSQYWWYILFVSILNNVVSFSDRLVGTDIAVVIMAVVSLALFLPGLGVAVRRLHDIGKSGWWVLLGIIPIIGWIILLVWYCRESEMEENQYGPVPCTITDDDRTAYMN